MTFDRFLASLDAPEPPPDFAQPLVSLWWDKKGDWPKAHAIAQQIHTVHGSAVHAYLHRVEGVLWNADYWYSRADRTRPDVPLDEEWELLVKEMLDRDESRP